jgi:hypothetical protein
MFFSPTVKYKTDIQYKSHLVQQHKSPWKQIMFIELPSLNLTYYNYNYHNDISIVVYKVLFINIVIFKLSILNQDKFITYYSNSFSEIFALTLISLFLIFFSKTNEYR